VSARTGRRLGPGTIRFLFDGREYRGREGDTAASALLAAGVRRMGRSIKYRRLRGVLTAGPEEPNALFTVGSAPAVIPNVAAPQLELSEGLVLRSQNRWPSLDYDLASLLRAGGGFFGAGFYYKTFIWPSWHTYESMIRALAGLGEAPGACALGPVAIEHLGCDVLVAGAGAAGLAAALAATRAGARVVVCEREPACGGELEFETATIGDRAAAGWIAAALAELGTRGARLLTGTTVVGASGGEIIAHAEPGGLPGRNTVYKIRPRALVVAMGAVERPIAFVDNDLPGVMLLGAAERYLARYGVRAGTDAVVFASHDRAYPAAARLSAGGVRVRMIVDSRAADAIGASPLRSELARAGTECLAGHAVIAALGGRGVTGARIAPLAAPADARTVACDTILVSGGWSPAVGAGSPRTSAHSSPRRSRTTGSTRAARTAYSSLPRRWPTATRPARAPHAWAACAATPVPPRRAAATVHLDSLRSGARRPRSVTRSASSSTCRTTSRSQTCASPSRRAFATSSTSSATRRSGSVPTRDDSAVSSAPPCLRSCAASRLPASA
jgi:sarcosine oxidase subunit alpha